MSSSKSKNKILIDSNSPEKFFQSLKPFDAIFIVAGLDNSTGANVAPGIAKFAKASCSLTIAPVVIYDDTSNEQLDELKNNVDAWISISRNDVPNVDEFLYRAVSSVSDLIAVPGLIGLDFADVKSVMSNAGKTAIGFGEATGEHATIEAVKKALGSPLPKVNFNGARGILLNIIGGTDYLSMMEVIEASTIVQEAAHPDAEIVLGANVNDSFGDKITATIAATRFTDEN